MSHVLLLKNGRLLCPVTGLDQVGDLEVRDGVISRIAVGESIDVTDQRVLEVSGSIVTTGFVDLHAHVGEPGHEYKEDISTASLAAAAGGFVSVCVSSNTTPLNDTRAITAHIRRRGEEAGGARMLPIAALTVGAEGLRLTEMYDLRDGGAVAFGDGERGHCDAGLMRRAMEYARAVGCPVIECPRDPHLAGVGVMHEGPVSTLLGLKGVPVAAEEVAVARAVALARQTQAPIHIGPVSAAASIAAIRAAKAEGVPVTCSVTAAHLHLMDEDIPKSWSPHLHLEPPLRSRADREVLREGLADGTIDAVGSGHRPQSAVEKDVPFAKADPGMIGFQTTFSLLAGLVNEGVITLNRALEVLGAGPRRALRRRELTLEEGSVADVVVCEPDGAYTVTAETSFSKSLNTPFLGQTLAGHVQLTLVEGRVGYEAPRGAEETNR